MCYNSAISCTFKYGNYIKKLKGKNNIDILDKLESTLLDAINTSNSGFVSEDGVVERWVGGIDKNKFTEDIKKYAKSKREYINKQLND